jgi:hypothetical protein
LRGKYSTNSVQYRSRDIINHLLEAAVVSNLRETQPWPCSRRKRRHAEAHQRSSLHPWTHFAAGKVQVQVQVQVQNRSQQTQQIQNQFKIIIHIRTDTGSTTLMEILKYFANSYF